MPTPTDHEVHLWSESTLQPVLLEHGIDHFGITDLREPQTLTEYRDWLEQGYEAELQYMRTSFEHRSDPKLHRPGFHSALVLAIPYRQKKSDLSETEVQNPNDRPPTSFPKGLRTALYSQFDQSKDYHHSIRARVLPVIEHLKTVFPDAQFEFFIDTAPILERDLAARAGLGWFGKNTCLIHRDHGSLFFLAEVYSTLKHVSLAGAATAALSSGLSPDFCGTCRRCIDACPTQALVSERTLDARLCISNWTIEAKTNPPLELRPKLQDWFFGCDICQTVCPWNEKVFGRADMQARSIPMMTLSTEEELQLAEFFSRLLTSSSSQLEKKFRDTALSRARGYGIKRNALLVIANRKLKQCRNEVLSLVQTSTDLRLIEIAQWTLDQLDGTTTPSV